MCDYVHEGSFSRANRSEIFWLLAVVEASTASATWWGADPRRATSRNSLPVTLETSDTCKDDSVRSLVTWVRFS